MLRTPFAQKLKTVNAGIVVVGPGDADFALFEVDINVSGCFLLGDKVLLVMYFS